MLHPDSSPCSTDSRRFFIIPGSKEPPPIAAIVGQQKDGIESALRSIADELYGKCRAGEKISLERLDTTWEEPLRKCYESFREHPSSISDVTKAFKLMISQILNSILIGRLLNDEGSNNMPQFVQHITDAMGKVAVTLKGIEEQWQQEQQVGKADRMQRLRTAQMQ